MNLLEALIKSQQETRLPGPLNTLPAPVKAMLAAPNVGPLAVFGGPVGQRVQDGTEPIAKAITGAGLTGAGRLINDPRLARANQGITDFIPLLALADKVELDRAAQRAARAQTSGNPIERAQQANEAGARGAEVQVGVLNALLDPINILPVAGQLNKAGKLGKLAEVAGVLDRAQSLPFEAAAKGATRAARPVLNLLEEQAAARAAVKAGEAATGLPLPPIDLEALGRYATRAERPAVGPMLPERGNVPRNQLTLGIGRNGGKGLGPEIPPVYGPDVPPILGPELPTRGNIPRDQLLPGIGRNGGKGVGPLMPPGARQPFAEPQLPLDLSTRRTPSGNAPVPTNAAVAEALSDLDRMDALRGPEAVQNLASLLTYHYGSGNTPALRYLTGGAYDKASKRAVGGVGSFTSEGRAILDGRDVTRPVLEYLLERGTSTPSREAALKAAILGTTPAPEAQAVPSAVANIGGDIAAGGDDKIIAPRLGSTLGGALAGGTAGAIGGAATADEDERFERAMAGFAAGAAVGGNLGSVSPEIGQLVRHTTPEVAQALKNAAPDTDGMLLLDPDIRADVITAVQRARDNAGTSTGVKGLGEAWGAFWAQWRRQTVDTPKQLPQDATYRAMVMEGVAREEFPGLSYESIRIFQKPVSRERATGAVGLDNPYNQILIATGNNDLLNVKHHVVGTEFTDAVTGDGKRFGRLGSAIAGVGLGLASGVKTVNPVSPIFGAVRGAVDLEYSAGIRHLIGVANDSMREAMAYAGTMRDLAPAADAFLSDLDTLGVEVSALRGRGGMFSAAEVQALAGKQAADDWAALSKQTILKVGDRVSFLMGDFRDKMAKDFPREVTGREKAVDQGVRLIGKAAPFASWQLRSTPVLAEIALRHPLASYYAARSIVAGAEQAEEEGLKSYQAGTVPTDTETPLLGGVNRLRTGGVQGVVRSNLMGALVPYGSETLVGDDLPEDATGYQKFKSVAGRAGFSPRPEVQAAMYVAGQDWAPGGLSRTAGLEGLADVPPLLVRAILRGMGEDDLADAVPTMPRLPSGRALLDAGRDLLEPVTGKGSSGTDPEYRRYAELVFRETKKPLDHPDNRAYLEAAGSLDNPLWERAVIEQRMTAGASNATGLVSPVSTTVQTTEAVQAQKAGKKPYTIKQIIDAPTEAIRTQMERANDQAVAGNPALGIYDNISGSARERELMARWEKKNEFVRKNAPKIYAERRKEYEKAISR